MAYTNAIASDSFRSKIAKRYCAGMRGDAIRQVRLDNLRRLRERYTLERIAERSGTNAVYLSQIANEAMRQGGKRPRSLSDAYAAKIEQGLGLPEGWMDQPHDLDQPPNTPAPPTPDPAALLPLATPRSRSALERIVDAARDGRLTDDDMELLAQIARRIAARADTYDKIRTAAHADPPAE